jgi:SAM-dependent methyltransferase
VPKNVFAKLQFDEKTFDGWHCYGADYSLAVRQIGLKAYVIPAFVYHRTLGLNRKGLLKYQKRLLEKYKYRRIFTTSGEASGLRLKMVSSPLFSLYQSCYERIFPHWTGLLSRELSGCRTVLDLGCGYNSPIRLTNPRTSVGVELFDPYIRESKKKRIHSQYVEADINRLEFEQKAFDAVLCMEVLEYLTKEKGYMLLGKMEKWAKRKVILTTPNGYLDKSIREGNPLQVQRAGWNAKELAKLGFKVFGINGWKKLKILNLTREPFFLREKVLDLSQKITYRFPKEAFQLFCVKEISE